MEHILSEKEEGCLFCRLLEDSDRARENLVLWRGERVYVVLNRYPYANGHLMVVPHTHTGELAGIDEAASAELWSATRRMVALLSERMKAEGFNVGFNLGRAGGAGIEEHLHLHIVPRWSGDTNFMPVLGATKLVPQALEACFDHLRAGL